MTCQTRLGKAQNEICGHALGAHEGEESGELVGQGQPCTLCPCNDYTAATWTNVDETRAAQGEAQNKTVQRWADPAMFTAEPIAAEEGPRVYLLWATPDPLAAIAAACKMYKGEVARSFADVSHAERHEFLQQVLKTKLQAPFEFVKFHFMMEGVTRAFTHQMVRQRTAVYAQESLRFAVKEDMPVALPPSLQGTTGVWREHETRILAEVQGEDPLADWVQESVAEAMVRESKSERQRWAWDQAVDDISSKYQYLVNSGVPAEDARGLLPHNTLTRLHYSTDLRALMDHAGNRLCTQAQFEWRLVFTRIVDAIRRYDPLAHVKRGAKNLGDEHARVFLDMYTNQDQWQYEALADLFRPVCYLTGKCEFKANFDRPCSIRDRVDANASVSRPSSEWHEPLTMSYVIGEGPDTAGPEAAQVLADPIDPREWLADPGAAR